jgi:hypothetical protein
LTGPVSPPPAPEMPPNLVRAPARKRRRQRRRPSTRVVVIVVALVLLVVVGVCAFLILKGGGLKTGSALATVSWKAPVAGAASSTASFTGKVDGLALQGKAEGVSPTQGGKPIAGQGSSLQAGHWSGTLGGTAFSLDISETIGSGPPSATANKFLGTFSITFHVTGNYGTDKVTGTAVADPHNPGRLRISGTVGTLQFKGTMSVPKKKGSIEKVRATFNVKG